MGKPLEDNRDPPNDPCCHDPDDPDDDPDDDDADPDDDDDDDDDLFNRPLNSQIDDENEDYCQYQSSFLRIRTRMMMRIICMLIMGASNINIIIGRIMSRMQNH